MHQVDAIGAIPIAPGSDFLRTNHCAHHGQDWSAGEPVGGRAAKAMWYPDTARVGRRYFRGNGGGFSAKAKTRWSVSAPRWTRLASSQTLAPPARPGASPAARHIPTREPVRSDAQSGTKSNFRDFESRRIRQARNATASMDAKYRAKDQSPAQRHALCARNGGAFGDPGSSVPAWGEAPERR
jgi:hypothetical protein